MAVRTSEILHYLYRLTQKFKKEEIPERRLTRGDAGIKGKRSSSRRLTFGYDGYDLCEGFGYAPKG